MDTFQYIRHDALVYERIFVTNEDGERKPTDKFVLIAKHSSISKAKHWSREQGLGVVRRYQTLERERGRQFMRSLFQ